MKMISALMRRIRVRVHDSNEIAYDDEEILDAINCGARFIRRTIAEIRPSLLASISEGILEAGVKSITLTKRPTKLVNVTAGTKIIRTEITYHSKKIYHNYEKIWRNHNPIYSRVVTNYYSERGLRETEQAHVVSRRNDIEGKPREFYLTGTQTLNFFPIPNEPMKYTVMTIDDFDELTADSESPFNTEYEDLLVDYAVIRLQIGNEYELAQENQLMSSIYTQIQLLLMPPPSGFVTRGYWGR